MKIDIHTLIGHVVRLKTGEIIAVAGVDTRPLGEPYLEYFPEGGVRPRSMTSAFFRRAYEATISEARDGDLYRSIVSGCRERCRDMVETREKALADAGHEGVTGRRRKNILKKLRKSGRVEIQALSPMQFVPFADRASK